MGFGPLVVFSRLYPPIHIADVCCFNHAWHHMLCCCVHVLRKGSSMRVWGKMRGTYVSSIYLVSGITLGPMAASGIVIAIVRVYANLASMAMACLVPTPSSHCPHPHIRVPFPFRSSMLMRARYDVNRNAGTERDPEFFKKAMLLLLEFCILVGALFESVTAAALLQGTLALGSRSFLYAAIHSIDT